MMNYEEIFKNKKVLVTGHTGFKGSWLSIWLQMLGAQVLGISLPPHTSPNNYSEANIKSFAQSHFLDIRSTEEVSKFIQSEKPDFIFHLAAQAIVSESYANTIDTWTTNTVGVANILEALKECSHECTAIIITSDKCYENVEWTWGYRENDMLGGADPYSASKAGAEILFSSYFRSFLEHSSNIKIASARAGNVIGGGDWAKNRILPDFARAWASKKSLTIRNPDATRPWQHVLEPLHGYIKTVAYLKLGKIKSGESFNFGPDIQANRTVGELCQALKQEMPGSKFSVENDPKLFNEAKLLHLNCDKAYNSLNWLPVLDFKKTVNLTASWYTKRFLDEKKPFELCSEDIMFFDKKIKCQK
jgi:CDP-glucose 4,6-dehydratase